MSVFADTSGFIAWLDEDDHNHSEADHVWRFVIENDVPVHTTNYVIVETLSLIHKRQGIAAIQRFCDDILPICRVEWIDEKVHSRAIAAVLAGSRRGPSLVDCTSIEVMRDSHINDAIAFDQHFSERGYRLPAA